MSYCVVCSVGGLMWYCVVCVELYWYGSLLPVVCSVVLSNNKKKWQTWENR
jgi:uncharacterized protein with PIN domain